MKPIISSFEKFHIAQRAIFGSFEVIFVVNSKEENSMKNDIKQTIFELK